jgi:Glycosyltransferase
MPKKSLLIIIDNLKKGGAEVLLIGILPELNQKFNVILVTLSKESDFKEDQIICSKRYNLGFKGKLSFISCVFKLKKIIKKHQPSLVHSHLIYSSLAARLACPSSIPLLYSIHNKLSETDFNNSKLLTFIEKATIKKNHFIAAVSEVVLKDYENTIEKTEKKFILKNYISDEYFLNSLHSRSFNQLKKIKLIAVGNIKWAKNYEYLVQSFMHLKNFPVSLDIFGDTHYHLFAELKSLIERNSLPVFFKGAVSNVKDILPAYDLYIMSSRNEGFGIAVVEAMGSGLPVLLSDIPVLREVTQGNALFFDLNDPKALSRLLKEILSGKHNLNAFSENGVRIAKQYTKQKYLETLFSIYGKIMNAHY